MHWTTTVSLTLFGIGLILTVILVPLSFSYCEYYQFGLKQRKTTGRVDTSRVYGQGRYNLGPDFQFLKYQADAHYETLNELSVFSAGGTNESIGLEFKIDIDFTFLLKEEEIGLLHKELHTSYKSVIVSRAKDAVKNEAIFVTFTEYFQNRNDVEERFKEAVRNRWEEPPSLHCTLDQFHLGRIQIPESVAAKQLESKVQNERNDMESYLQEAQLEREMTAVDVNSILLEKDKILSTARAEANLKRAKATVEANRMITNAYMNGTKHLFQAVGIETQDHRLAFTYIRTLRNRDNLELDVSYLTPENILRTKAV